MILRGMVDSRRTRRLVEDVVEDLPGVRDVHNELRSADRMRGSKGDPSRSGASGSDTGKVEVTGDESGSPHATPSARDTAPGSTPIGHTYQGTGMGTGGVDSMTWSGAGGGPQRTGTGGGIGAGATGSGVMNPGSDVGGMPFGMTTGSDLGSMGQSGTSGTGNVSPGRSGDLGGAAGSIPGELGTGTLGSGQVGNTSAVGTGTTMTGGMAAGSAGTVSSGGMPGVGTTGGGTSDSSPRSGPSSGAGATSGGTAPGTTGGSGWQIRETMTVVGSDGEDVGQVKEVHADELLLDRSMHRDLWVPFGAIRTVDGERVLLSCPAGEIDNQGWRTSDLMGTGPGTEGTRSRRDR